MDDATGLSSVWRLEFQQPAGHRDWVGPYVSSVLTERAEHIVRFMTAEHHVTRPDPPTADAFLLTGIPALHSPVACGCASLDGLLRWFGPYCGALREEGAHVAHYGVRPEGVLRRTDQEILFRRDRATLIERTGHPPPTPPVRSSAGSRASLCTPADSPYAFTRPRTAQWRRTVLGEC
ncbi:hypothetical protein [Pseudonocardia sp. HH130630-07]|uniref:hypothetical protein n=1 Tax=Pseudonocardia sp. HH130630-07 TaxID=1690815 RepID=UPI000814DCD1|nr:hypothetical protein [Pseudonocardia sp. HH130630-07]ANY05371.1 hypothetical protein AFB00_02515 [Pseudonocardia sp. HH130630-07]